MTDQPPTIDSGLQPVEAARDRVRRIFRQTREALDDAERALKQLPPEILQAEPLDAALAALEATLAAAIDGIPRHG